MVFEPCYDKSMLKSIKNTATCNRVISDLKKILIVYFQKYRKGFAKMDYRVGPIYRLADI